MTKEEYNPVPIYSRKLARKVLKQQIEKRDKGNHNTNAKMHEYFEKYKNILKNKEEKENA